MSAAATSPIRCLFTNQSLLCLFVLLRLCYVSGNFNQTFEVDEIPNFNITTTENLIFCGPASYDHDGLQVSSPVYLNHSYWLTTADELGIWKDGSFSTVFDMSISPDPDPAAATSSDPVKGLTFLVLTNYLLMDNSGGFCPEIYRPEADGGPCSSDCVMMGLTFDPQNNQLVYCSIMVDNDNDTVFFPLNNSAVDLSPSKGEILNRTVWIDVNTPPSERGMKVYIANQGSPKPLKPVFYQPQTPYHSIAIYNQSFFGDWTNAMGDGVHFGFTGPAGNATLNKVSSWTLSVEVIPKFETPNYVAISFSNVISASLPVGAMLILLTTYILQLVVWFI